MFPARGMRGSHVQIRCDNAAETFFFVFLLSALLLTSPTTHHHPPASAIPPESHAMPPKQVSIELGLEQQRIRLEESVSKLRKSLETWRTWSAEYEAFREELQALPEDASRDDMVGNPFCLGYKLKAATDVRGASWQPV